MNILKRFALVLLGGILFISLIGTAWAHVGNATLRNRETIKGWFTESNFYDRIVDVALEGAHNAAKEDQQSQEIPLDDPQIKKIAVSAFPPEFLQKSVETIVDNTYSWLEGDSQTLNFNIDLSEAKGKLADGLAQYAVSRAQTLPACTAEQAREALAGRFDLLNADCVPAGVDISALAADLRNEIATNEDIPQNITVDSDAINLGTKRIEIENSPQTDKAQTAFRRAGAAPVVLGIVAALSSLGIIFLSAQRRNGFLRAGIVYVSAAIALAISQAIFRAISTTINSEAVEKSGNNTASIELMQQFIAVVSKDIYTPLLWYAVITGLIGAILIGAYVYLGKHPGDNTPESTPSDKTADSTHDENEQTPPSATVSRDDPKIQL